MSTVLKMRCARVSEYDSAGQDMRELQLVSSDRESAPLDPDTAAQATLSANLLAPAGAEIEHDQLYDVTITPSVPV